MMAVALTFACYKKGLYEATLCNTLKAMNTQKTSAKTTSTKRVGLVPSIFCGAPVAFVLAGILANFVPALAALAIGAAVGTLCGRTLLKAL